MSNISQSTELKQNNNSHIIGDLVSGRLVPGPIWKKREYRLKFLLRSLLFWSATNRMLNALSRRPDFDRLLATQITLPSKSHRQYLTRGLHASQRADAIINHYHWLDNNVSRDWPRPSARQNPHRLLILWGKMIRISRCMLLTPAKRNAKGKAHSGCAIATIRYWPAQRSA